uniref:Uncharacterized protein n=1 Tax=Lepeophtheirus salmonis TaxID=72036 RepID=A0A0K2VCK1_LEPSM
MPDKSISNILLEIDCLQWSKTCKKNNNQAVDS